MTDTLSVRALYVTQLGKIPLYNFFLKGNDILRIADISRVERQDDGKLFGYQRAEVATHIQEIADYLDSEEVIFPNSIILAMSSSVAFKRSRGPQVGAQDSVAGVLEIPLGNGKKPAWIVDGQQRTMALNKCRRKDLLVPVTAFVSDDFEIHRSQFLLVNKARPLPRGLINELLPEVDTTLPPSIARNKIPSALCNILHRDPDSPFFGLIRRQTTDVKDKTAVIIDNSLIHIIRESLNSVHGCLYQYKNVASGEIDSESIRKTLNVYWQAVKELFPDAWGRPPAKSRLMHGVGLKAMGNLMDRVMYNIRIEERDAKEKVKESLSILVPHCAWTKGKWEKLNGIPWNQLQNTAKDIKLLSNMLIRIHSGVEAD